MLERKRNWRDLQIMLSYLWGKIVITEKNS
jgi:hypothetical protein